MTKVTNLNEISCIANPALRSYIHQKAAAMMEKYGVSTLDDIGCFVVLEPSENQMFAMSEMEFIEMLHMGNEMFLHGVRILGDSYGEDTYLPVEVVAC